MNTCVRCGAPSKRLLRDSLNRWICMDENRCLIRMRNQLRRQGVL